MRIENAPPPACSLDRLPFHNICTLSVLETRGRETRQVSKPTTTISSSASVAIIPIQKLIQVLSSLASCPPPGFKLCWYRELRWTRRSNYLINFLIPSGADFAHCRGSVTAASRWRSKWANSASLNKNYFPPLVSKDTIDTEET